MNGNELHELCGDKSFCFGYMAGVLDAFSSPPNAGGVCAGEGVTPGQMMEVVRQYLATHPERWHHAGPTVIWEALRDGFGC